MQTFLIIGRSGCGKGTQAQLLADSLGGAIHLSTGEKFREFIKRPEYLAQLSREAMGSTGYQPQFLAVWAWTELFLQKCSGDEHLIMEGLARRPEEGVMLEEAMRFMNRIPVNLLFLDVSREWSTARLLGRGRTDDTPARIEDRHRDFERWTMPTMEWLRAQSTFRFHHINGEQKIEDVHQDIIRALGLA